MTISQKKIQKILELWKKGGLSVPDIAKITKLDDNTVRNYLRKYGLLNYSYSSSQQGGPPSLVYLSTNRTNDEQKRIKPQTDGLQMTHSLGENLIKELDNKNIENETLTQKLAEVTTERDKSKEDNRNLTQENLRLTQKETQQTTDIENLKRQKEELQTTMNEQKDEKVKMKQNYQRELEKEKTKAEEKKNHEILEIKKEFLKTLQERNGELSDTQEELRRANETKELIKKKCEKIELDYWILEHRQKNSLLKHGINTVVSLSVGMVVGHYVLPAIQNMHFPQKSESRKNIAYLITPILQEVRSQSDIQYINSGVTPETTASFTLCSGAIFTHSGDTFNTGYDAVPTQQDDMILSNISRINSGAALVTNTSGTQCPRACLTAYGNNTGTEYADFPNQQPNIQETGSGVTLNTNTSVDPGFGAYFSNHTDPLQDVKPIHEYTPPLLVIPRYSLTFTPPDNLLDSFLMQQLLMTDGKQFEVYMGRFFIYQGYRVTFTKAGGDYGADLVIERDGVRTVVQCRQRKESTGVDAIQTVHSAKEVYHAPHALVISTSEFTKSALNLAKIHDAECWDGHRLLEELYKHQFFYPPE